MSCGQVCYPIDVAIVLDHISLVAVELGLGTCWIGAFDEGKVKEVLGINCNKNSKGRNFPEDVRVVELMLMGYPAFEVGKEKNRLSFEKVVRYDRW